MDASNTTGNPWFTVSVGLMGLILGYTIASGFSLGASGRAQIAAQPTVVEDTQPTEADLTPASEDDDIVLGDADAPVTIVEFSDVQCPFCRKFNRDTLPQILKTYVDTGKVKLVFRDYPLPFHPGALPAAMAIECGQDQSNELGWAIHDELFAEQDKQGVNMVEFDATTIKDWVKDVKGLNQQTFASCLDAQTHKEEVEADTLDGQDAGIQGTPGFWIVGPDGQKRLISGAYPFSEFQAAIEPMLQ
jgi:protein-disulfide isomerase